jgi:hypothetical protein
VVQHLLASQNLFVPQLLHGFSLSLLLYEWHMSLFFLLTFFPLIRFLQKFYLSLQISPTTIGWPTFCVFATTVTSLTLFYNYSRIRSPSVTNYASSSIFSFVFATPFISQQPSSKIVLLWHFSPDDPTYFKNL